MPVLRTPDTAFAGLPGYPFAPHYTTIDGGDLGPIRLHHLDEGPGDGPVVLLMHGEPSWSYLYRTMIPPLVAAGARVPPPTSSASAGRTSPPRSATIAMPATSPG